MGDDDLAVRMELLHKSMERRGPSAETGDRVAQGTAARVLFALLDGRPQDHERAWRAFAARRPQR